MQFLSWRGLKFLILDNKNQVHEKERRQFSWVWNWHLEMLAIAIKKEKHNQLQLRKAISQLGIFMPHSLETPLCIKRSELRRVYQIKIEYSFWNILHLFF